MSYIDCLHFSFNPSSTTLEVGAMIDRYGGTKGTFASPQGTPIWARSLPVNSRVRSLNTYQVLKSFNVDSGITTPWFGEIGGGIQYDLGQTVQQLIDSGYLGVVE